MLANLVWRRRRPARLYDSTFSRAVWRLYGGAKGLTALFWAAQAAIGCAVALVGLHGLRAKRRQLRARLAQLEGKIHRVGPEFASWPSSLNGESL